MLKIRPVIVLGALAVLGAAVGTGVYLKEHKPVWLVNLLAPKPLEQTKVFKRFAKEIYPLLTRDREDGCVGCHDTDNKSPLKLFGSVTNDFQTLLVGGYLAMDGPDSLLSRITTPNAKKRMPKGRDAHPWTVAEAAKLKTWLGELNQYVKVDGKADELFPPALQTAYTGTAPDGLDNTFITYRQLKGKIRTIFNDDWVRDGHDHFEENLALFGGADFKERFNETSKASSGFLTGLEMLSRDVAARAYSQRTGPFTGRPDKYPPVDNLAKPDSFYQTEITRLYQAILFRAPTDEEMRGAFGLIKSVYHSKEEIQSSDTEVTFKLTVTDEATKLSSTRALTIPVSGERHALYQELIDESKSTGKEALVKQKLARHFPFQPGDPAQVIRVNNVNTLGNVSFAGVELRPVAGGEGRMIPASNLDVQVDGAWKLKGLGETSKKDGKGKKSTREAPVAGDFASFEDDNLEKGASSITVPVNVAKAGEYEVALCWRRNAENAREVLVEVLSSGPVSTLARTVVAKPPPRGEAHFFYDSSADTVSTAEFPGVFQFGPDGLVEINNQGTRGEVTASGVKFITDKATTNGFFLVDGKDAEGSDKWNRFDSGKFKAYNRIGTPLTDLGEKKGELFLRFKPAKADAFKADKFYQLAVGYPAKAKNEVRTPVIVKAQKSSPIIQLSYPARARGDAVVEIDASGSYTVQGSRLKFQWQQTGGPAVKLDSKQAALLRFTAPRRNVQQAAWEALTRALLRHPDFLFTRPPSIVAARGADKRRLQLVKLALDLVGRAPKATELDKLAHGASLAQLADDYLATQEFRDFYFHRIRLYLESQGTVTQDEPARLWCYVAFNDRPFQEILTADYTVDKGLQKQPRPAYHGRTGVLTTRGFIEGKPGLPHYNYAAQVSMLFLGYVFEVPPEVVEMREGITASGTTDPGSICYSCHKLLTPLAMQRQNWDDDGKFHTVDDTDSLIDGTDHQLVEAYPFAGDGLQAFATQAVQKERFIRTIVNTHFTFYFGREMRCNEDERFLYKRVWDALQMDHFKLRTLIRTLVTSPEYLEGHSQLKTAAAKLAGR